MKDSINKKENDIKTIINNIKKVDSTTRELLKNTSEYTKKLERTEKLNNIYNRFTGTINSDSFRFSNSKNHIESSYDYLYNLINPNSNSATNVYKNAKPGSIKDQINKRINIERLFSGNNINLSSVFSNKTMNIFQICDEIESITAYLYQLDEAVYVLRDNVMNVEQAINNIPFNISFSEPNENEATHIKEIQEVIINSGIVHKLNEHIVPKTIKYGRYFVINIPYSEIGISMLAKGNHPLFNKNMHIKEGINIDDDASHLSHTVNIDTCMESVNAVLDVIYESNYNDSIPERSELSKIIKDNISGIIINDTDSPPNLTGLSESVLQNDYVKDAMDNAIKRHEKNSPKNKKNGKNNDTLVADCGIDPDILENITGCYTKLVDQRLLFPIEILEHRIGYYYFENYDYVKNKGNTITDILSNDLNFEQDNMLTENIVNNVLSNLKYGDLLNSNNDFKSLILNCILYTERKNNPIRIKFIPANYVTEFKTNCDENGNGQPVLLRSLIFGRLYVSLLMFYLTAIFTKSTDTEFYYFKTGAVAQSYEQQVADLMDQFEQSNIDIGQILNGDLLKSNKAINKRYFIPVGTQDIKPFDLDISSGQQIDINNELLTTLRKMAVGASGVPSVAIDYLDEIEFATLLKMTNSKTGKRSNTIQLDFNPSITELVKQLVKLYKPNMIPNDVLESLRCTLRPINTQNTNISSEELNNVTQVVDYMISTFYSGEEIELTNDMKYAKEAMRKHLIMTLANQAPWSIMENYSTKAVIEGKKRAVLDKTGDSNNANE